MANSGVSLVPYLHFQGNCEDALNHYVECLGGEILEIGRYDSPSLGMEIPEHYRDKVLHARLLIGGNAIMASDVFPNQPVEQGSRIHLVIELDDEASARRVFEQLSEGGSVTMPLEKQFWGALYGQLVDRFGIAWMINCQLEERAR